MIIMKTNITYAIYARKSSESEERQVQSIQGQLDDLVKISKDIGVTVPSEYIFKESKSAKDPDNRPEFQKVLQLIDGGQVDGLIVWQMDRLFRNPVDGGRIQWLLQQGKLKSIQTVGKEYIPEDNSLLLSVESGMATQYVRDLSKKVHRGLNDKFKKGMHHGVAPHGYLNTKMQERGENNIYPDPERFDVVQRAWKLFLTGAYSAPEIQEKMNNEWGFLTRKRKKTGGRPMSYSGIYKMLSNIIYAGYVVRNGETVKGVHKPMVSLEDFDKAQFLLGRKGKPRTERHEYAYTGLMKCECGGFVSATTKHKLLKSTGEYKKYVLYYCTSCKPRWHMNLDLVEKEFKKILGDISIPQQLNDVLKTYLAIANEKEIKERNAIYETQKTRLRDIQSRLDNLTGMRIRDLIDDDEFKSQKDRLGTEKQEILKHLELSEQRISNWQQVAENYINLATDLLEIFNDPETPVKTKREIISQIGWNCTIKDKKVFIELPTWAKGMKTCKDSVLSQYNSLELAKYVDSKGKNDPDGSLCSVLRGGRDLNSQPPA